MRNVRLITLTLLLAAGVAQAEDWPRWRGVRGDGTWLAPPLPEKWPTVGLKQLWRQPLGGGYAGVSVDGNYVVTMDRRKEPEEVEQVLCRGSSIPRAQQQLEHLATQTLQIGDSGT